MCFSIVLASEDIAFEKMIRRVDADALQEDLNLPQEPQNESVVISGESDIDGETDELYKLDPSNPSNADVYYDSNLDAEDEAYVYRNMRGGRKETVTVIKNQNGENVAKRLSVYKPRSSDAVLQCPLCFQLICMDCQRHERYWNQFRAMFVMGISVDWNQKLVYDELQQALVEKQTPGDESLSPEDLTNHVDDEYFAVLCANCHTRVAALDMKEEVYYFHGCLESS